MPNSNLTIPESDADRLARQFAEMQRELDRLRQIVDADKHLREISSNSTIQSLLNSRRETQRALDELNQAYEAYRAVRRASEA